MSEHKCIQERRVDKIEEKTSSQWEDIAALKQNDISMAEKIDDLKKTVSDHHKELKYWQDKLEIKIDNFIASADEKYASSKNVKKIWTIIWSIIGFVFTAIWGMLLTLLFNKG